MSQSNINIRNINPAPPAAQAIFENNENDMDIIIDNDLIQTIIVFPPKHTNIHYEPGFTNVDQPTALTTQDLETFDKASIEDLPSPLIQFITSQALKNTAASFRLRNIQDKLKTLLDHKNTGSFPKHYKVKLSVPNNNLVTSEKLSQLALSTILVKDIEKTQADFTSRLSLLQFSNIQLLMDCHNHLKGITTLIDNNLLRSDFKLNPILQYSSTQVMNTIVRFNQNTIQHNLKAELKKSQKIEKQQKFQDSLRKQSALLIAAESPNIHNEPALLEKQVNSLRSELAKTKQLLQAAKNVQRIQKSNPSNPSTKVTHTNTKNASTPSTKNQPAKTKKTSTNNQHGSNNQNIQKQQQQQKQKKKRKETTANASKRTSSK